MFIGHYAVGLASKQFAPRASLGALIAAPILLDLLWPVLVLMGREHFTITQNQNPFLRFYFDSYPISHGLVAVVGWAVLYASLYFGFTRYLRGAIVIGIGVLSHWLLDYIVHRPDLPLFAGNTHLYGLGLWNHRWVTMGIEVAMLAFAIWIYLSETTANNNIGTYAFWGFILFLLLAYAGAALGPAPSSEKKVAIFALFSWLMIPWAWWFDKHRSVKQLDLSPATGKLRRAAG